MNKTYYTNQINSVIAEVKKAVIGKDAIIIKALLAMLCKGHILIEDIPGVGKTTLALAFSKALSLKHNRMQFTPDVLPSDVTGFSVYNKSNGKFEFRPGVAFCNLFLADEINRTSSKTQSALLELMEEKASLLTETPTSSPSHIPLSLPRIPSARQVLIISPTHSWTVS